MSDRSELKERIRKIKWEVSVSDTGEACVEKKDQTSDGEKPTLTFKLTCAQSDEDENDGIYPSESSSSSQEELTIDAKQGKQAYPNEIDILGDHLMDSPDSIKGHLPRPVYFINATTDALQAFKTFDELSDYLVEASCCRGKLNANANLDDEIASTVLSIPLGSMVHHVTIGKYIRYLYEKDRLTDVNVEVVSKTFKAHKIALASYSEYFANLFSSAKGTKNPLNIRMKGVSEASFAAFLEFVYTGEASITPDIAFDVMVMADYLKVTALRKKNSKLIRYLPSEHFLKVLTKNKDVLFSKAALRRAKREFRNLIDEDGILAIDVDLLCTLLKSDRLNIDTEYQVFLFVVRWISHDVEERLKYATRILNFVRFTCMTQLELFMCSEATASIRGYEKFREHILIANWILTADKLKRDDQFGFHRHTPRHSYRHLIYLPNCNNAAATKDIRCLDSKKDKVTTKLYIIKNETGSNAQREHVMAMPPPLMTSSPNAHASKRRDQSVALSSTKQTSAQADPNIVNILVIGGFQIEASSPVPKERIVERYDVEDNQWKYFCKMQEPRRHHAVVTMAGTLYLLGGCSPENHTHPTRSVYAMDLTTKIWTQVADMQDPRQQHCACVLNGKIYVLGGIGLNERVLETVERYDPGSDTWKYVSPLAIPVYAAAAAILHGRIYLAGGITKVKSPLAKCDLSPCLSSYDPVSNRWSFHNDMRFQRCRAEMVNIGDRLFLCGGATITCELYSSRLISVSSIDEYIDKHEMWCHLTDLVIPRHDLGVAVAGERIYIVGGTTSTGDRVLKTIECYDTRKSSWLPGVQDLPYPTQWLKCVTVVSPEQRRT